MAPKLNQNLIFLTACITMVGYSKHPVASLETDGKLESMRGEALENFQTSVIFRSAMFLLHKTLATRKNGQGYHHERSKKEITDLEK